MSYETPLCEASSKNSKNTRNRWNETWKIVFKKIQPHFNIQNLEYFKLHKFWFVTTINLFDVELETLLNKLLYRLLK